jgi:hypothetical protein
MRLEKKLMLKDGDFYPSWRLKLETGDQMTIFQDPITEKKWKELLH